MADKSKYGQVLCSRKGPYDVGTVNGVPTQDLAISDGTGEIGVPKEERIERDSVFVQRRE